MVFLMEKENIFGIMGLFMRDSSKKVFEKEKAHSAKN